MKISGILRADSIIEIVRQNFADMRVDVGGVSKSIDKKESKRAMPFVQGLKRSLESGINPQTVFERKLAFDEVAVLKEMVPGLKQTVQKCDAIDLIVVDPEAKTGRRVGGSSELPGGEVGELPQTAENAVPGQPTFFFENTT